MSGGFTPDHRVREVVEAYSLDAVDDAQRNMRTTLDWSEASIEKVETMLASLHDSAKHAKPSAQLMEAVAKAFGSYIGEVFIRHHGGSWGMAEIDGADVPALRSRTGDDVFFPWVRALQRLRDGPEENVWHYYLFLTGRLGNRSAG